MHQKHDILDFLIERVSKPKNIRSLLKLFVLYCFKTKTFPDLETLQTYLEVFQNLDETIVTVLMAENQDLIRRVINLIQRNNVFYQQKTISETKEVKVIPLVKHIFKED